jgi:hypothetical protein
MKLYEVPIQERTKKGEPAKPIKSHLVIEETGPLAHKKVRAEYPDHKIGKPNMMFDFNPK